MPDTNGHSGNSAGDGAPGESKLAAVLADAKAVQARAVEELKATVKAPSKTDVWKSVLRVKHDETPRSRALGVLSNVFLHLHPSKINRDAVAYNYTWGMGGAFAVVWVACRHEGSSAPDDGAGSVKLARFAFGPPVEAAQVHHNLSLGIEFDVRPVHGARRRTLEVDAFGIVAAAVAGALELIFALLPVRRAAQVSADGRDDEDALGIAHHPDAGLILEFGVDPEAEIRREIGRASCRERVCSLFRNLSILAS